MVRYLPLMSFNHRSSTDTDMYSSPRILVCVALVFTTAATANGWNQRSNLIDLGTSILLPWESLNNGGSRESNYNTVPNSEILRLKNIGNQNLNERNELQQKLRELGRISNELSYRKQILAQGSINSDSLRNAPRQYSIGNGQNGLKRQNGYTGLGSYSTFSSNPALEQEEELRERIRQRQSQYLDQARNYQSARQNLGADEAAQLNKIRALGGQLGNVIQDQRSEILRNSAEASNSAGIKLQAADIVNQLSNLGLLRGNAQQKTLYGRPIRLNSLRQIDGQSYSALSQQSNQAALEEANIQQDAQEQNYGDRRGLNSLRSLKNQQLYRPIGQILQEAQPVDARIVEQPQNDALYAQGLSAQTGDLVQYIPAPQAQNANPEILVGSYQPQYQVGLNQQQQQQQSNAYTYGELNAKIWNVIRSNPAMISNLENLREQLQNDNAPENEQMRQLRALLQKARQYNRNIQISGNGIVAQTPEEQERNAVVANLIDAMNKNEVASDPSDVRGRYVYGGWGA